MILVVSSRTVARKFIYLGNLCRHKQSGILKLNHGKIKTFQFDEWQTIEHAKCKPLSAAVAVFVEHRKILVVEVSSMPATGYLATIAVNSAGRTENRPNGKMAVWQTRHFPCAKIY